MRRPEERIETRGRVPTAAGEPGPVELDRSTPLRKTPGPARKTPGPVRKTPGPARKTPGPERETLVRATMAARVAARSRTLRPYA